MSTGPGQPARAHSTVYEMVLRMDFRLARRIALGLRSRCPSALVVLLVMLVAPAHSTAMIAVDATGHERVQPWQTWLDRSLIPLPQTYLPVRFVGCNTVVMSYGCMQAGQIFVDPASPPAERRRIELHELGHLLDATYLTDADRDEFRRVAHAAGGPWYVSGVEVATAGEQFAEAFSLCAMVRVWDPDRIVFWRIYWKPTPKLHARVCAWFRGVAATRWS